MTVSTRLPAATTLVALVFAVAISGATTATAADLQSPDEREKPPHVTCTLSLSSDVWYHGDSIGVRTVIENDGHAFLFYNPYHNGLLRPGPALIVYDAEGKYVGDLLHRMMGSERSPSTEDFVPVATGGIIGYRTGVKAMRFGYDGARLPAGKYKVQICYPNYRVEGFGVLGPQGLAAVAAEWARNKPMLRSNVVEIELRDGERPPKQAAVK